MIALSLIAVSYIGCLVVVSKLARNEKGEEIMLLVKENLFSSLLDKPTFGESIEIPCIEPNLTKGKRLILSCYNSHRNLITEPLGQAGKSSRPEAFFKNMFFRTLQKSQENTCIEVFFIKLQDFRYSFLVFRKGPF